MRPGATSEWASTWRGLDSVARHYILAELNHRAHLRLRKIGIAQRMAGIVDFDADRARIGVGLARPHGSARMPGAHLLANHLRDEAQFIDQVVA